MPPSEPTAADILDKLPVSVFRLDRQHRVLFANRWACAQVGDAPEAVVGRTCPELGMPPDTWAAWRAALDETFATGRPGRFEFLSPHPVERLVEFRFTPEWGTAPAAGPAPSVLVAALTIDEVRQLRTALRDSEGLLRAFLDRAPAIAWLRDADGRYVFVNRTYLDHYGLRPEDRLGKTPAEVWPADVAARFLANDRAVLASGEATRFLEAAPEPGGGSRDWLNVKFPFAAADGGQYIGGIGIDVTDQRAADARMAAAARAESLGLLAAGAAHDFNNLMAAVLGHAGLAAAALGPDAPGGVHLKYVQEAAARAVELCRQMQALARPVGVETHPLELGAAVREAVRMALPALAALVELDVPAGPVWARATPGAVSQIVMNLLVNASDAMRGRPGEIVVSVAPAGGGVVLAVRDRGTGIAPDVLGRIFEPFFTTKGRAGTGLGLAVVHGTARALGGEVAVESEVGVGTTFRVRLPAADPG